MDGQVYAQVLYVSNLAMAHGGIRNVVFICTMHNSVYAFDADAVGAQDPLWQVNFGPSVPSATDVTPEIGILGTGAIDLQAGALYVVAETLGDDGPVFTLHALDLASGAEVLHGPTFIAATVPGTGAEALSNHTIPFDPNQHLQRPGLLVVNGSVYVGFSSHSDTKPWHGWIMSYASSDISRQTGVFLTTPTAEGAAFWQSGRGLAADDTGSIYAVTGNGEYDGVRNFGESVLKLPASLAAPLDWFTPANWIALSGVDGSVATPTGRVGMTLSANSSGNGILREITESASDPSFGTIHAFDASNLASELWNSDMNSGRDALGAFPKFVSPTVANGKLYTPTFSNAMVVYGLLSSGAGGDEPGISAITNAASYRQDAVSSGEIVAISGNNLDAGAPVLNPGAPDDRRCSIRHRR